MNNFDIKNLNQILEAAKSFYKINANLDVFIENFDVWIDSLSPSLDSLKSSLRGYWWDFEQVLAHAKYKNKPELDPKDLKILHESISKIITIINASIEKYLKLSDPEIKMSAKELDGSWVMCPSCLDAWETSSQDPMVICPKCNQAFHNPRNKQK